MNAGVIVFASLAALTAAASGVALWRSRKSALVINRTVRWHKPPTVHVASSDSTVIDAAQVACSIWRANTTLLSRQALTWGADRSPRECEIVIRPWPPPDDGRRALARLYVDADGYVSGCVIWLRDGADDYDPSGALLHELWHALVSGGHVSRSGHVGSATGGRSFEGV